MPQVFPIFDERYTGFWGVIRYLIVRPPPMPEPEDGGCRLPFTCKRRFATRTPAGFSCTYDVSIDMYWETRVGSESYVNLSHREFEDFWQSLEQEVLNLVLEDAFFAYGVADLKDVGAVKSILFLYRADRSAKDEAIVLDAGGEATTEMANSHIFDTKWHWHKVSAYIYSIKPTYGGPNPENYDELSSVTKTVLEDSDLSGTFEINGSDARSLEWVNQLPHKIRTLETATALRQRKRARRA